MSFPSQSMYALIASISFDEESGAVPFKLLSKQSLTLLKTVSILPDLSRNLG
jgi:hypothetical protein